MNVLICDAIRARRHLRFVYEGYERLVEPHLYGINTANHEMLSAYLVGGWSASSPEPGWRNYLVLEMHDLHVLSTEFEAPRPDFNPDDPALRQVYCRLEPSVAATTAAADGPNADDLYRQGRDRMERGELAGAIESLEQSVQLEPHFKTLELLGECLARLGRPREAIVPLAAASALHRGSRSPALLADVFLQLGRHEQAAELAGAALAVEPDNELARAVLAEVRRHRGPDD